MENYNFDVESAYRLVDVQDHSGASKVESRDLYKERVGCIAKKIRTQTLNIEEKPYQIIRMEFVMDSSGRWIYKRLRTSPVLDVYKKNGRVEIKTINSIYVLEPAELPTQEYQDAVDLIELYLSDEGNRFVKGFYYDADKAPHELEAFVHEGLIVDSCLVHFADDFITGIVCRYFIQPETIEFYDTLYHQQEYNTPILIHNCSDKPMKVEFPFSIDVWTIEPWSDMRIEPPTMHRKEAEAENNDIESK